MNFGKHGGKLGIHGKLPADPVARVPDDEHDEQGLQNPRRPRGEYLAEQDAGTQHDKPDLDVVLGADRLPEAVGESVAD